MRNLKKVLSLVLCVAMMLSVMVMGTGAASFTDEDEFSPQYQEAAEVLAGMKVMQGYDDGSFLPQRNITRAQVATMIYRAATSDVSDTQADIYADYDKFDDVQSDDWFAGYVNYCANAELIKGFTPTTFGPNKNVTGYQVLAMILRAVGYDANDEFTGTGWEIRTASTAQQLGMLDNVQEATLGQPATRELVAELIFQALNVKMVKYTPALGYVKLGYSLGQKEFDLTNKGDNHDDWGRPGTLWTYNTGDKSTLVKETALATYTTAVTECDVADALGFDGTKTFTTYTNGVDNSGSYKVQATDTKGTIGAQGRLTEVYKDEIVYIDTFLANVTAVKDATFDANGHLKTSSSLTLNVWTKDTTNNEPSQKDITLYGGSENYTYEKGDYLLVNAVLNGADTIKMVNQNDDTAPYGRTAYHLDILGEADSFVGGQTTIWVNANQHVIEGTTYDDANTYFLDVAGNSKTDFVWFLDQYGNVIGSTNYESETSYAIITGMKWVVGDPGYAEATLRYIDGSTGTVIVNSIAGHENDNTANFEGMSGNTWDTFTPKYIANYVQLKDDNAFVSNDTKYNGMYRGYALYKVEAAEDGAVDLTATNFLHKNASVVKAGSTVLNSNGGVGDRVYLDDATVFVARQGNAVTGYTYVEYVGKDNVPTYMDNTASVFYIKGSDNVADFVYIQSGTLDGSGYALVAAMDDQYSNDLYEGENLYVLASAQVNGVDVQNGVASANSGYITSMADSERELYYVEYDASGLVSKAEAVTTADEALSTSGNNAHKLSEPVYTAGKGTLIDGRDSWNVTNVPVYGDYTDLADVTDFDEVSTYIVENSSTSKALAVYVYDIPEGTIEPTVNPTITGATLTGAGPVAFSAPVDGVTFTAAANDRSNSGVADAYHGSLTTSVVWYKFNETTGNYDKYLGTHFTEGKYYAEITISVKNADGENYSMDSNAVIKGSNISLTDSTGAVVTTTVYTVTK